MKQEKGDLYSALFKICSWLCDRVSHTLVALAVMVNSVCVFCVRYAVLIKEQFLVETACNHCEVHAETEETVEHQAFNTADVRQRQHSIKQN
jgi:hypothetical protein